VTEQRLSQIEARQAETLTLLRGLCDRVDEHADDARDRQEKLERLLHGANGAPGLIVRVDRLEQAAAKISGAVRRVGVAVLGAMAAAVGAWLQRR
jgi:hypothetical protein